MNPKQHRKIMILMREKKRENNFDGNSGLSHHVYLRNAKINPDQKDSRDTYGTAYSKEFLKNRERMENSEMKLNHPDIFPNTKHHTKKLDMLQKKEIKIMRVLDDIEQRNNDYHHRNSYR